MPAFTYEQPILFRHCDPAGIVFYPRYLEMVNDCTEASFAALGHPWVSLHRAAAVPTVRLEVTFSAPSRHGDTLLLTQRVAAVGRTSVTIATEARVGDERRLAAEAALVHVGPAMRPEPWPDGLRAGLARWAEA